MEKKKNTCEGCIFLNESPRISHKYECRHKDFRYVKAHIKSYLQTGQSHSIECGHNHFPQPPTVNEIAWACRDLPGINVEFLDDYTADGVSQWPFRFLLEEVVSCTGKMDEED